MRGMSVAELLVALVLVLIVAAGLSRLAADAHAAFRSQPAASDLVQRARVVLDALAQEIALAGGGFPLLDDPVRLIEIVPPVLPRGAGPGAADLDSSAFADRITTLTIPDDAPQSAVAAMASPDREVELRPGRWCPPADPACGFGPGDVAILVDVTPAFDLLTVAAAGPGWILPEAALSRTYGAGASARLGAVRASTYRFDAARGQLRRAIAGSIEQPVVDHVVAFNARYFADPFPPIVPWQPAGTCVVDAAGAPRLPVLAPTHGTLAELSIGELADGPWCGAAPNRFDADLYRVRLIRLSIRLQVEDPGLRGRDRRRFLRPGSAADDAMQVGDVEVTVDVSPRSMRQW